VAPGMVVYFLFPIVLETIFDLLSYLLFSKRKFELNHANKHEAFYKLRHPLVYHPRYYITSVRHRESSSI